MRRLKCLIKSCVDMSSVPQPILAEISQKACALLKNYHQDSDCN